MKGFFQNIEKQPSLGELHYLISKVVSKNAEQMLPCKLWLKAEETITIIITSDKNAEFAIIEIFLLRQNVFKHEILINITKSINCKFLV